MNSKPSSVKNYWPLLILLGGYILVALYFGVFLHYDFLRSDVLGYWQDSLAWRTPFHSFHVPGYPLMIALLRGITFRSLSAIGLMMSINLAAFLTSAFFIYNIFKITGINDKLAAAGMLLFGFWPLVGLTYTVDPLADIPATFLFLMGFYFLLASRRLPAALLLGLSMVTHKAMWPFTGLLLIADFIYRREFISKRNIAFLIVMLLPTGVLWLLGSFYHHSVTWLFSGNLGVEISPRSDLLILDGLLGTFIGGGIKGLSKGIILIGFACVSVFTIYASLKLKYENYHYGLAVSFAVLFLFLILNQNEIWAAMRFGRLMVIPLTFIASTHGGFREKFRWNSPASIATWSILLLSQFAYAWYMATVFFG